MQSPLSAPQANHTKISKLTIISHPPCHRFAYLAYSKTHPTPSWPPLTIPTTRPHLPQALQPLSAQNLASTKISRREKPPNPCFNRCPPKPAYTPIPWPCALPHHTNPANLRF
eukprot:g81228.t1